MSGYKVNKKVEKLINSFPEEILEKIGQAHQVDHNVSRLYGDRMFKLLIYAMSRSDRITTRYLEELYNESALFRRISGKGGHQTRHSSLADRINSMPVEYFAELFEWTISKYGSYLEGHKTLNLIKRFDSSMIQIGAGLVDWGMDVGRKPDQGKGHKQLKLTLGFHGKLPGSIKTHLNQDYLSEEKALKQAIEQDNLGPQDIIVFDRGLKSRKTLVAFDKAHLHFVTRGLKDLKYEFIEPYRQIKGRKADDLTFIQDSKVYLFGSGNKPIEHVFRLVEVEVEAGKRLTFLTNIWNKSAMDIARFYQRRWDIEVFFRILKQNLGVKHLFSRTENGIQIQMYCALIVATMLLVIKKRLNKSSIQIAKFQLEENLLFMLFTDLEINRDPYGP